MLAGEFTRRAVSGPFCLMCDCLGLDSDINLYILFSFFCSRNVRFGACGTVDHRMTWPR
jgi:hypothetical protein